MEYQIGDKVRIREDLKAFCVYGGAIAFPGMLSASEKVITICGYTRQGDYEMSNGYCYPSEMLDQNRKEDKYMKTSKFKAELEKMGYTFEDEYVKNEQDLTSVWISPVHVNAIITGFGPEISPKLFKLITKYTATPIAERKDEKLFNVQIVKGNWGIAPWLYRNDDNEVSTSSSDANNYSNQQWTLEQIKEYEIDDESVYKRVPVEEK